MSLDLPVCPQLPTGEEEAVEVTSTFKALNTIPERTSQGYLTLDVLVGKRRLITEDSPAN